MRANSGRLWPSAGVGRSGSAKRTMSDEQTSAGKDGRLTLEELHGYIASQYGSESGHLFRQDPTIAIFKRPDNKKWFAVTKDIEYRTLGIEKEGRVGIVNVKLDPFIIASLHGREGFCPAWHMNREN